MMETSSEGKPIRVSLCPLCRKPAKAPFRPFCSKHCADLDLSRWLNGVYAVPARDEEDEDGDADALISPDRAP
jgi:hypothetical protein